MYELAFITIDYSKFLNLGRVISTPPPPDNSRNKMGETPPALCTFSTLFTCGKICITNSFMRYRYSVKY